MKFCLFVTFVQGQPTPGVITSLEFAELKAFLLATPQLCVARLHSPAHALDPMLDDGPPPALVLQLIFTEIEALESALAPNGYLQALPEQALIKRLAGCEISQQAMLVRSYAVPQPSTQLVSGGPYCTYLVGYEGPAEDTAKWLWHYMDGHPGLMARLPGIGRIEIYSRLDWCGFLPWPRENFMQRNQVVFDSEQALTEALASPLRAEMRAHFEHLPAFSGLVTHFPMSTLSFSNSSVS